VALKLITAPTVEPVALDEAKAHLRIDIDDDDLLITAMIAAARQYCENKARRSLLTQTWELTIDSFPGPSLMGVPFGTPYSLPGHAILLERGPVQSITSIKYTDMASTEQTMPSTDYVSDLSGEPARITPIFGRIWPINLPQIGSVRVRFVAGYGDTADTVPQAIRSWILLRLGALYENREEVAVGTRIVVAELPFLDGLLDPYIVTVF
jgi:uncharacterized phiE125 gp8 family phage protein